MSHYNRISLFYSLLPIVNSSWYQRCNFTQSLRHCLRKDKNRVLIIVRYFSSKNAHNLSKLDVLAKLREKYDQIIWFDDGDGAGCTSFEVLPFVDLYWKKQLFRSRDVYMTTLYGRQLYSDYYHRKYGVQDEEARFRAPIVDRSDLNKLRVAWNNGMGAYPLVPVSQRAGVALSRIGGRVGLRIGSWWGTRTKETGDRPSVKAPVVFARFGLANRPSIDYQRRLLEGILRNAPGVEACLGRAPKPQYDVELASAAITLSPFGWGEICFRDFEAIIMRSVLAKPDMSHLDTWPDVFIPGETYEPLSWDGTDMIDKLTRLVVDLDRQEYLRNNAFESFREAGGKIGERLDVLFSELRVNEE